MTNVVPLKLPRAADLPERQARLMRLFACDRRGTEDVFWLKENAEILNILETSGADLPEHALDAYAAIYDGLAQRLKFFPQYYRFLLSICLDLEDLGMPGDAGARICADVAARDLAAAELSDLQRGEAVRLLARRGAGRADPALDDRLRAFISHSDTFALPNRKAAYELTHIVFYLSEYGRRDPRLGQDALRSLEFAGLLAYLDQNADLLAEICVSLRFAGQAPSPIWEAWLQRGLDDFILSQQPDAGAADDYHDYLVGNWWAALSGRRAFAASVAGGPVAFLRPMRPAGPLRAMSEVMFRLGEARSADWSAMRPQIEQSLGEDGFDILDGAERSTPRFGEFFEGFARA